MEIAETESLTPHEKATLVNLYHQRQILARISRQLFNAANPVDEYLSSGVPSDGIITWSPDYELPERITDLIVSIPVGATSATIYLGGRHIVLMSEAALTAQRIVTLAFSGMILGRNDTRKLIIKGACTTDFYVNLSGHVLEREGDR
jgi:hypothetical protein